MAVLSYLGTISGPTSTGVVAYTGVGFAPKVLIFFCAEATPAQVNSVRDGACICVGAATSNGPTGRSAGWGSANVDASNANSHHSPTSRVSALEFVSADEGGSSFYEASVSAWGSDGFSLNWLALGSGSASKRIYYLALGGDIQAAVGSQARPTSNGTQAVTGVGFKPAALLVFGINAATGSTGVIQHSKLSIGFADSALEQGYCSVTDEDGAGTSDAYQLYKSGSIFGMIGVTGTIHAEAALDSLDADGFTLDWTTTDGTAGRVAWLALGNCTAELDHQVTPVGGGLPWGEALGPFGTTPFAMLFAGASTSNDGTVQTHGAQFIGATAMNHASGYAAAAYVVDGAADNLCRHQISHDDAGISFLGDDPAVVKSAAVAYPVNDSSKEAELLWDPLDNAVARRYMSLKIGAIKCPARVAA